MKNLCRPGVYIFLHSHQTFYFIVLKMNEKEKNDLHFQDGHTDWTILVRQFWFTHENQKKQLNNFLL